jgi:hypothetical protein
VNGRVITANQETYLIFVNLSLLEGNPTGLANPQMGTKGIPIA